MTPQEIETAARRNLNAENDDLWSQAEILEIIYRCSLQMSRRAKVIEKTATDTVVASQDEYDAPTRAIEIWRLTYSNKKLQKLSYREFDAWQPNDTTILSGEPIGYTEYAGKIILIPTPATGGQTLKYWYYAEPDPSISASSTLEVPTEYHDILVHGVTYHMAPKDLGHPLTGYWQGLWQEGLLEMERHIKRRRRGDRNPVVQTEEDRLTTDFGVI